MKLTIKFENVPGGTNHIDLRVDDSGTEFDDGMAFLIPPDIKSYDVEIDKPGEYVLKAAASTSDYQVLKAAEISLVIIEDVTKSIDFNGSDT